VTVTTTTPGGETTSAATTVQVENEPEDFFKQLLEYDFNGQWGRTWDRLHPGHQQYVDREQFSDCNSDLLSDLELKSVETVEVYDDPLDLPDVPEKTSKAVTLKFTVESGGATDSATQTVHAVLHEGQWTWVLPPADLEAYKSGTCPSTD